MQIPSTTDLYESRGYHSDLSLLSFISELIYCFDIHRHVFLNRLEYAVKWKELNLSRASFKQSLKQMHVPKTIYPKPGEKIRYERKKER